MNMMNLSRTLFLMLTIALLGMPLLAQDSATFFVAFYNVENLFNPQDDSLKNDDAFTPQGFNHWTYKRYVRKVNNLAKVMLAMNEWHPPDVVAMAEVEDAEVLRKLCFDSPLQKYGYRYVHYESPDVRGIDVALLYRSDRVKVLRSMPIPITFPFSPSSKNRDLLYAVLQFSSGDSLHLFVNHWTSRYGGYAPTIPKRNYYAQSVKRLCDSLLAIYADASILIVGDFNDYPTDESMRHILCATASTPRYTLHNLMLRFAQMNNVGTHKHEDFWGCLDQIVVSAPLLDAQRALSVIEGKAHIFDADFLLEADEKYGGVKPFRTFSGPRYRSGYSDHLPVYVRLRVQGASVTPYEKRGWVPSDSSKR